MKEEREARVAITRKLEINIKRQTYVAIISTLLLILLMCSLSFYLQSEIVKNDLTTRLDHAVKDLSLFNQTDKDGNIIISEKNCAIICELGADCKIDELIILNAKTGGSLFFHSSNNTRKITTEKQHQLLTTAITQDEDGIIRSDADTLSRIIFSAKYDRVSNYIFVAILSEESHSKAINKIIPRVLILGFGFTVLLVPFAFLLILIQRSRDRFNKYLARRDFNLLKKQDNQNQKRLEEIGHFYKLTENVSVGIFQLNEDRTDIVTSNRWMQTILYELKKSDLLKQLKHQAADGVAQQYNRSDRIFSVVIFPNPSGVYGTVVELTGDKNQEQKLQEAYDALQLERKENRRFSNYLTENIELPIQEISQTATALKKRLFNKLDIDDAENIIYSANYVDQTFHNLIRFGQCQLPVFALEISERDLYDQFELNLKPFIAWANQDSRTFNISIMPDTPRLLSCDWRRINEIVQNLSYLALNEDSGAITMSVSYNQASSLLNFKITTEKSSFIASDINLPNILGLRESFIEFNCRTLTKELNGEIDFVGESATFAIPITPKPTNKLSKKSIIIVSKVEQFASSIAKLLKSCGNRCISCDGLEELQKIKYIEKCDLIIIEPTIAVTEFIAIEELAQSLHISTISFSNSLTEFKSFHQTGSSKMCQQPIEFVDFCQILHSTIEESEHDK